MSSPRNSPLNKATRGSLVIFDLYGTLVNWNYAIGSFVEFFVSPGALSKYFECDIREISIYRPYRQVLEKCLLELAADYGVRADRNVVDSFILTFAKSPPYPDTVYGIKKLREQGLKTCVLSNTDRELIDITLSGLKPLFDYVITAEDVKSYKPLKDAFLKAYDLLSIAPSQAIHVSAYPQYDLKPASE
ncbi:MAG: HAD-IA family hydrolase, partial [Desulfurococcaceae archaeon]